MRSGCCYSHVLAKNSLSLISPGPPPPPQKKKISYSPSVILNLLKHSPKELHFLVGQVKV